MKWLWLLSIPLAGWFFLIATSHGVLIRDDPMLVNENKVITDAACVYSSGLRTATILIIGDQAGAECNLVYKFGSLPFCQAAGELPPGSCQDTRHD